MKTKQAQEKIEKAGGLWSKFVEWMNGQTMGLDEDGEVDFYDDDVDRFIKYKCDPNNEPQRDWD